MQLHTRWLAIQVDESSAALIVDARSSHWLCIVRPKILHAFSHGLLCGHMQMASSLYILQHEMQHGKVCVILHN